MDTPPIGRAGLLSGAAAARHGWPRTDRPALLQEAPQVCFQRRLRNGGPILLDRPHLPAWLVRLLAASLLLNPEWLPPPEPMGLDLCGYQRHLT